MASIQKIVASRKEELYFTAMYRVITHYPGSDNSSLFLGTRRGFGYIHIDLTVDVAP